MGHTFVFWQRENRKKASLTRSLNWPAKATRTSNEASCEQQPFLIAEKVQLLRYSLTFAVVLQSILLLLLMPS